MVRNRGHIRRDKEVNTQYNDIRNDLINRIKDIEEARHTSHAPNTPDRSSESRRPNTYNPQPRQSASFNVPNTTNEPTFNPDSNRTPRYNEVTPNNERINSYDRSYDDTFARPQVQATPYRQIQGDGFQYNPVDRKNERLADATHSKEKVQYKPRARKSFGKSVLTLAIMLALIFGLAFLLREFVFQAYEIPSGSMEKTIMTGDMVFAEKISHNFGLPKQGDIVTFTDPLNSQRILIKRVVAVAGQKVDIKNNKLYVDDKEMDEPYTRGLYTNEIKSSNIKYPITIPENSVWVMGDNRTNSQDSRYFGPISNDKIIGHALFVYWPFNDAKFLN